MLELAIDTNLLDPELIPSQGGPPHQLFDAWRSTNPVHWNPPSDTYESPMIGACVKQGFWVLTRYQDVYDVSRNQQLFSSHEGSPIIWDFDAEHLALQRANIMGMKPAQHAAVKRLVLPPLSPGELQKFQPEIERTAKEIIDSVASKGGCEFVFDVASKLPVYTFCKLMGVPDELHETLFQLGNATADTESPARSNQSDSASMTLFEIARELTKQKKANPDNAMLSRLINGKVDGQSPDEDMINMFVVTLSIAGHETTRSTAAHFVRLMNEYPDQYRLLRGNPEKYLPNAIEEVLRFSPPVIKFRRTVMEDTEIGGYPVAKGDKIYISYPAANRDPAVFTEPHRFDISRENASKHLSFGTGPHVCLGARLARSQLRALLMQIVTRIPDIHPAGEKEMLKSIWFNAIIKMPVAFKPE